MSSLCNLLKQFRQSSEETDWISQFFYMSNKPKSSVLKKDNKRKGLKSNPSEMQNWTLLLDTNRRIAIIGLQNNGKFYLQCSAQS